MSIGRRFWNMARSELNSLLDRAAEFGDGDEDSSDAPGSLDGLDGFSERELQAELERRRRARDEEKRAWAEADRAASGTGGTGSPRSGATGGRAASNQALRKAYMALEIPEGSDLATVKTAYRKLMRKYHPDRHVGSKEKEAAAHDLSLRLTESYETLKRHLAPRVT